MKLLHILPACLILFVFACIVIRTIYKTWKKEKYNEKMIYVKDLMKKAKTEKDKYQVYLKLLDLQSRYNTPELMKMIEKHCLKNKS
jgi:hypothetical protein